MSLVVPKVLGVTEYASWQVFILYMGFGGILMFGSNDGVLLRLGGRRYTDLDYAELRTSFRIIALSQLFFAAIIVGVAVTLLDHDSRFIALAIAVLIPIMNSSSYLQYILQATNHADVFARSSNIQKVALLAVLAVLLVRRATSYEPYVAAFLATSALTLLFLIVVMRQIFTNTSASTSQAWARVKEDVFAGINLMIAYYAGVLILGASKLFVQWTANATTFGNYAFSISLMSFILAFVAQVGVVIFPVLKRFDAATLQIKISRLKILIDLLSPLLYLVYPIVAFFISRWLPDYTQSALLFGLLIPALIWDIKMNTLYLPLFKAFRYERQVLKINLTTMLISILGASVAVFLLHSVVLAAVLASLSIGFRCFVSESYLNKRIRVLSWRENLFELSLMAVSSVSCLLLEPWQMAGIALVAMLVYWWTRRSDIKLILKK